MVLLLQANYLAFEGMITASIIFFFINYLFNYAGFFLQRCSIIYQIFHIFSIVLYLNLFGE